MELRKKTEVIFIAMGGISMPMSKSWKRWRQWIAVVFEGAPVSAQRVGHRRHYLPSRLESVSAVRKQVVGSSIGFPAKNWM